MRSFWKVRGVTDVWSPIMTTSSAIEELKAEGNKAFAEKDYKTSIEKFTEAIDLDPSSAVFYSNRSAAYACQQRWHEALADAEQAIALRPDWSKGYGRKGAALQGVQRWADAAKAYSDGLVLEPGNAQLQKGKEACESNLSHSGGNTNDIFSGVLGDPQLLAKLAAHPKTASFVADPKFCANLSAVQRNPSSLMDMMKKDKRILEAVLVGMNVQAGAGQQEPSGKGACEEQSCQDRTCKDTLCKPKHPAPAEEERKPKPSEAEVAKELGNAAYLKKDFEAAMEHYKRAFELDSTNMNYLLNQSAVLFEMANYQECIEACLRSIEVGREHKADFKQVAKAYSRVASAHHKQGNLHDAVKYYNKSLTEHRTPDALEKLRAVEREVEERRRAEYHDSTIAETERNLGNDLFKQGQFAEAVKHYTEAIKRDESDPRAYSNRAACYTKLAAVPEGLKDCETAIKLDPSFIKAYVRKAHLLILKREFTEATMVCDTIEKLDADRKHVKDIQELRIKCRMEQYSSQSTGRGDTEEDIKQRALKNPEVMQILADPAMQSILQQMQSDPRAAGEHMRNPMVAAKIRKLMDSGILRAA